MRVVADSHAIFWYFGGSARLSAAAAEALAEAEAEGIVVSVATLIDLWYVTQTTEGVSADDLAALRARLESSSRLTLQAIERRRGRRLHERADGLPGDHGGALPESLGHNGHIDTGLEGERGPGVPQAVEADGGQVGELFLPYPPVERLGERLGVERQPVRNLPTEFIVPDDLEALEAGWARLDR